MRRILILAATVSGMALGAAAQTPQLAEVIVTASTPLTAGTPPPAGRRMDSADIARIHALDVTDLLRRSAASVHINDIQNNPLQPDVNYRGFTASPLLGTPQGLSVYMDGVRLNQPFGDVVDWDLIPRAAIDSLTIVPGSSPLFGRNTLGGALSIRTRDGLSAPGSEVHAVYGSNQRRMLELTTGGSAESGLHWFATGNHFAEDGWRVDSPTRATQLFGKLGWRGVDTRLAVSGAFADTDLTGNGLQEQRLLSADRASVYTKPDVTENRAGLINLTAEHRFSDALTFSGNAYWRHIRTRTFNGDINDDTLTENVYQPSAAEIAALNAAGVTGFPLSGENAANTPFPRFRCIANALLNSEPGEKCNALLNRTATRQHQVGAGGEFTHVTPLAAGSNRLTFGASWEQSRAAFVQSSQYGYLTPDRGVVGVTGPGAFADGTQDFEDPDDARVDLIGRTTSWGVYANDAVDLARGLTLTVSARYDQTQVRNSDRLLPGGGPGSLDGKHDFKRLNPSAAFDWRVSEALGLHLAYGTSSRAPSAIELGCADPENPCRLPNALAGDPPLDQVVAHTADLSAHGALGPNLAWNAGVFRADSHDDILFVADDQAGFGYFRNFGKTRREGVELGLTGVWEGLRVQANYTRLNATYRSAEAVNGASNSSNEGDGPGFEGEIDIEPGDRIPLIPKHVFKTGVAWTVNALISVNADVIAQSGVIARGNENGEHEPDGVYYLGDGHTDGYAVFNLGAELHPTPTLTVYGQIDNLLDASFETAAQLGATGFTQTGAFLARPFAGPVIDGERPLRHATFYAPGAPRMLRVGAKFRF